MEIVWLWNRGQAGPLSVASCICWIPIFVLVNPTWSKKQNSPESPSPFRHTHILLVFGSGFTSPQRGRKHVFNGLPWWEPSGLLPLNFGHDQCEMPVCWAVMGGRVLNNGLQIGACWTVNFANMKWLWENPGWQPTVNWVPPKHHLDH